MTLRYTTLRDAPGGTQDERNRPQAATGHIPFAGHRTQREIRETMERLDRDARRMAAVFAGEPKAVRA